MGNIKPKELSKLGYTDNAARSIAVEIIHKYCKHDSQEDIITILQHIIQSPEEYRQDATWGKLALALSPQKAETSMYSFREVPISYRIFGENGIDDLAKSQMATAMLLPVTIEGALMPDGCAGYGLPIGGVLATTDDIVIPYAVGKDIACRMSLTILDAGVDFFDKHYDRSVEALVDNTAFGLDGIIPFKQYHPLFDKNEFRDIAILRKNREKAIRQLGSSGKGNHFVDLCEVNLDENNGMGLPAGCYVGILSHSGSRGLGCK